MLSNKILYYRDERGKSPAWAFIQNLPPDEYKKCMQYLTYLEQEGERIKRPIGDYIGQKLYELRPKQARIIYFFTFKNHVIIAHAFRKKENAISNRDIQIALNRMNDFMIRYQQGKIILED